jgi:hypothetical protein
VRDASPLSLERPKGRRVCDIEPVPTADGARGRYRR